VLARVVPLAGVAYAAFEAAGDLTIGEFPNGNKSAAELATYYAAHHTGVARGGMLMAVAAVFLALFGAAIWGRLRDAGASPVIGGTVLIGTALAAAGELSAAATYAMLGSIGADRTTDPAALQAWHLATGFGVGGGTTVLLLGVFAAGVLTPAVPAWLGVTGLLLGIAQMTPYGFFAGLLFLLWAAIAGVVFAVRSVPVGPPAFTAEVVAALT
jgi:hypothetical protein